MAKKTAASTSTEAQPQYKVEYREIQPYGTLKDLPIALDNNARKQSVETLNQVLVDTMTLRDMYKKHHWQMSGATFYQLHLLLDKHYEEQANLVDMIAERIMALGGISIAMAADVAEMTTIARPPRGREDVPTQLARLLEAHENILRQCHEGAEAADESGDDGTNDLLVSNLIRTHEPQVWFLAEHLAATELVRADR
ncbi:Dps family protein [Sphingomonas glacialis]|uniref:DNA starvation/stationary phase protection protein n=1 Tax=Sphingomonas glacialis TaxID=658225 RepID=A0A502FAU2_9SPHN|nr:DNA starvation/stationary phase protection protein [Sphingomonas glacialis]TPG46526.1 DNA starvation/stationary phase protection protein [Sphingomonas glacialis]